MTVNNRTKTSGVKSIPTEEKARARSAEYERDFRLVQKILLMLPNSVSDTNGSVLTVMS